MNDLYMTFDPAVQTVFVMNVSPLSCEKTSVSNDQVKSHFRGAVITEAFSVTGFQSQWVPKPDQGILGKCFKLV